MNTTITHTRKNNRIRTLPQDVVLDAEGKVLKPAVEFYEEQFGSINQAKRASRLLQKKGTLNSRPVVLRAHKGK